MGIDALPNKPKRKSKFNSKEAKVVDQRVSTCSECRRGIFKRHQTVWTPNGLIHSTCVIERQDETNTES